jgi:preprotein translocase subunit SecY
VNSELARRIAFTLGALLLFRIGTFIPVPGIDPEAWQYFFRAPGGGILGVFNASSGGAVGRLAIFALGITPYISAAIILQLVSFFVPRLRRLQSSGEQGRWKLERYTRLLTLLMALFQSYRIALGLEDIDRLVTTPGAMFVLTVMLTMTGGTLLLVWLCDQITLRGIGNGIALILCVGIVLELPSGLVGTLDVGHHGFVSGDLLVGLAALTVLLVGFAALMEKARRREVVEFYVGGGAPSSRAAYLSFKLNGAGIIPALIASWLMTVPLLFAAYFSHRDPAWWNDVVQMFDRGRPLFWICYAAIMLLCVYIYAAFVLDPDAMAEKLKRLGGIIPLVEPGDATAAYLDRVVSRAKMFGAVYFLAVCLIPQLVLLRTELPFFLAGTSLLILVCTVLDLESQVRNLTNTSLGGLRE